MKVLFNHFQSSLHLPIQVHRFPSTARYGMSSAEPRPEMGQNGEPHQTFRESACKMNYSQKQPDQGNL